MPFCPQCGSDNPDAARFCDQCGAALIPVNPPAAAAPPTIIAQPTPAPAPAAAPVAPVAPVAAPAASASAGPSTCPQCGMSVIPGEAFCDNCGASLIAQAVPVAAPASSPAPVVPQQPSYPPPQQVQAPAPAAPVYQPAPVVPPAPAVPAPPPVYQQPPVAAGASNRTSLAGVQIIVESSGAVIPLPAQTQAMIGRADVVSNFFPEVDLTPYQALENGVGRRHLRLLVQNGQVFAEDQDSTNGSWVNAQRLQPRQLHALKSGDMLRLGQLALRIQF